MSFIKFDGVPDFDFAFEVEGNKERKVGFSYQSLDPGKALASMPIANSVNDKVVELRKKYKAELQRLILHVHRPGLARVYIPEMKREFLIGSDKTPLASIWVEWPNPGDYIVVIRSEIYVGTVFGLGAHGCEGEA